MAQERASASYDAILEELLSALEDGGLPDRESLLARHPQSEATVDRVLAAVGRYLELRDGRERAPELGPVLGAGEALGDFVVEGLLAQGGMARIYRARQRSLGERVVALKVFGRGLHDRHARARFEREALSASSLHHPHLAEVYGFGEARGLLFYAMRLVEGPTLRDLLERLAAEPASRASPALRRSTVERATEVASALSAIHAAGLVHRDIKPSNILLESAAADPLAALRGRAVLVDFGLVRPIRGEALTLTQGAGTAGYASPEQLLGSSIGPPSDVFSLGVTLHDLLSGRGPAHRPCASAGLESLSELVPGIDADLSAVVARAVDPGAEWRYRDGAALCSDLGRWLAGEPVEARSQGSLERARRLMRRHPERLLKGFLAAAGALLLVFALLACVEAVRASTHASRARARGDIERMALALAGIPPALAWLLPWDGELRAYASRLSAADPRDPLVLVRRHLRDEFPSRAVETAATHLYVHGIGDDPLLRDWLLSEIAHPAPSRRSDALRFVARLFYERDDQDAAEQAARRAFREALLWQWAAEPAPGDRLYLLTALSGCALPEDAEALLAWGLDAPDFSEQQRLALRCVERVVRRSNRLGLGAPEHYERLWQLAAPGLARLFEKKALGADACTYEAWQAVSRLAVALILGTRAVGAAPPFDAILPSRWARAALPPELADSPPHAADFLTATGDPRLVWLLASATIGPSAIMQLDAHTTGLLCGVFGDAELSERLTCLWKDEHGDAGPDARALERGIDEGLQERCGRADRYRLDPESHLGAFLSAASQPVRLRHSSPVRTAAEAAWNFGDGFPAAGGMARAAEVKAVFVEQEEARSYLRFPCAGQSEMTVSFEVQASAESREIDTWLLTLSHLRASRPYYPYLGEAYLALDLDGSEWVEGLPVEYTGEGRSVLALDAERLPPGLHRIRIRLLSRSTTTYRLTGVCIEPFRQGQAAER